MLIDAAFRGSLEGPKVSSKKPRPAMVREGHAYRASSTDWIGVTRGKSSQRFCTSRAGEHGSGDAPSGAERGDLAAREHQAASSRPACGQPVRRRPHCGQRVAAGGSYVPALHARPITTSRGKNRKESRPDPAPCGERHCRFSGCACAASGTKSAGQDAGPGNLPPCKASPRLPRQTCQVMRSRRGSADSCQRRRPDPPSTGCAPQ